MSRTFRKSNADNRRWDDYTDENKRDGRWNGRFSREQEDREQRAKRLKKFDKREISLAFNDR